MLLLVGAVLALLAMEGAVRVLDVPPRPLEPLPLSIYRLSTNPVIGYEYCPTQEQPASAEPHAWTINADGFRDRERSLTKAAGTYRIVALGDSTTAGNGIPDPGDLFTSKLEALLEAGAADGQRCEVLNMGVGGYHTFQEVETLRAKGLKYDPDLVLVTLCLNDFDLGSDGGVYEQLRERNRFAPVHPRLAAYRRLLRVSRLAFVLCHRLGLGMSDNEWERHYLEQVLGGDSPVRAGLAALSELRQEHGFEVLVVVLPYFDEPYSDYQGYEEHRRVLEDARGLAGIEVVDLLARFGAVSDELALFSFDGLHMNQRGHAELARMLSELLRERAEAALR